MDIANYVNAVGIQINNATKYNVALDRVSITNLVLIKHLNDLLEIVDTLDDFTDDDKEEIIAKLNLYILNLKKEINFYSDVEYTDDCILTETDETITQE